MSSIFGFLNNGTLFLDNWATNNLAEVVTSLLRLLCYNISELVYGLLRDLYNIFEMLSYGQLLDNEGLNSLFGRVSVVLGLIMLFLVAFSFVQMIVDPDAINDKEKGVSKIATKVVIVLVMLGVSGYVFNMLRNVQTIVLESNFLSKLLLPGQVSSENFGGILASEVFMSFYTIDEQAGGSSKCATEEWRTGVKQDIADKGDFTEGQTCLLETNNDRYYLYYNHIFCVAVGLVICWMVLMYCISVGMRMMQLAVLQIISPMAIISYLSPKKDNMFSKWFKLYFSTYIDVFIRVVIINFVSYLIALILRGWNMKDSTEGFWYSIGNPQEGRFLIGIIMIIALMLFAKKAPDLIKELFPSSGKGTLSFGIKSPSELFKDIKDSPFAKPITKPIGFLGKRALGGLDSAIAGQGFWRGVGNSLFPGDKLGKYMPLLAEKRKTEKEGKKEVTDIDNKWKAGLEIALNLRGGKQWLMKDGKFVKDENGRYIETDEIADWNKVFDGECPHYYEKIFKNSEFIRSKMAVDKQKKIEEEYRHIQQAVSSSGGIDNYLKTLEESGNVIEIKDENDKVIDTAFMVNGEQYTRTTFLTNFQDDYQKASDTYNGVKEVHESIRKKYQTDAKNEDQYKFFKNNDVNPANTKEKSQDKIKEKERNRN